MNLNEAVKKCSQDLDDMMSSISAIKGKQFAKILALHLNYCTLVSLTALLRDEDVNPKLCEMLCKISVICASTSLATLCEALSLSDADTQEIIDWGERLHHMVQSNINLTKGNT
jgi:hypothetical protein